ncbi:hypothetical protein FRC0431_01782 [Corynebacterium diphtheriae]|nr:hypothetical protein FRC0431_01782 [Corynebacterium diphtheriae]
MVCDGCGGWWGFSRLTVLVWLPRESKIHLPKNDLLLGAGVVGIDDLLGKYATVSDAVSVVFGPLTDVASVPVARGCCGGAV